MKMTVWHRYPFRALALAAVVLAAPGEPRASQGIPLVRAADPGQVVIAPDGTTTVERLSLDRLLIPTLLEVPLEASLRVIDWPMGPGARAGVLLTRHDVYAPGAILYRVEGDRLAEVPRSRLVFLWGEAENEERSRIVVSIDPASGELHGYSESEDGWIEIRPAKDGTGKYLVARSPAFLGPLGEQLGFDCGQPTLPDTSRGLPYDAFGSEPPDAEAITSLHKATLAVDTDNELMLQKFSNNTTNASNYIASLFGFMTVIYERDLRVRLLQGTTFLRVSSMPDPYNQSGSGSADSAKLQEFRNYWTANHGGVSRAAAMMLSGKQGSPSSSSGIAYVDALCDSSFGYSFTQVFKFAEQTASSDTFVTAHEVGHNFGSRHTHCYLSPTPIDTCYNSEGGCYAGATSCPAPQTINGVPNVRGTVMSYCHTLGGCSAANVFHPRTVAILDPIVESHVGECVFPVANPKEASPAGNMTARRGSGTRVVVTYTPACGASQHTVYAGALDTLHTSGLAWGLRYCSLGTSGSTNFDPGAANIYFVVVGNNGATEGSYGMGSSGERPPAGAGPGCSYTQDLSGTCP